MGNKVSLQDELINLKSTFFFFLKYNFMFLSRE